MKYSRRILMFGVISTALLVHVGLVLRSYPPGSLLRGEVPLKGDIPRYYATAYGAAEAGGMHGYDPLFMAGYPVGLWNSMGKKGYEVLHLLFPRVPLPTLFYLTVVGLCIMAPLLVWWALRRHCPTRRCSLILFSLCLVYWHLSTQISYFWDFGNIFFPSMSCLLIALVSTLQSVVDDRRPVLSAVLMGVLASVIFYGHTVVLLAGMLPLGLLLIFGNPKGAAPMKRGFCVALALVVFGVLIAPWAIPLAYSRGDCLSQPKQWLQAGPKHLIMDLLSDRVYLQHFDRNFLYHVAVVMGLGGAWIAWRRRAPLIMVGLGVGGAATLVLVYTGSHLGPLASVQPFRFIIPATLLLLGPMALFLDAAITTVRKAGRQVQFVVGALLLILAPEATAYLIDLAWPPIGIDQSDDRDAVLMALREEGDRGRVLTDQAALGHVVPYRTGRPVLGGLSSQAFLKHRFAGSDEDGVIFGRPVGAWAPQAFGEYLRAYAVSDVLLTRPVSIALARRPGTGLQQVKQVGSYTWFQPTDPTSFVLQGQGVARADGDGIHVTGVGERQLVLSYHFAPSMQADNGVVIAPETVLDDPVPFIRATVPEGVAQFTIRYRP